MLTHNHMYVNILNSTFQYQFIYATSNLIILLTLNLMYYELQISVTVINYNSFSPIDCVFCLAIINMHISKTPPHIVSHN